MGKNDDDIRHKINQLKDVYSKIDLRLSKGYKLDKFSLTYNDMKYLGYKKDNGMITE